MLSKPILIYRLTPAQIAFVDRLAETTVSMNSLTYAELVTYQELEKLGFAAMCVEPRRKAKIVLTELGGQLRAAGYISKKPVARVTESQTIALRFLDERPRRHNDIPGHMKDVCRRMALRGWAATTEDAQGHFWMQLTTDGRQMLHLLDY